MTCNIFEFWANVPGDATCHPNDRKVLDRVRNGFKRRCLPGPFNGRLRTAPVVLLFLSPGFKSTDLAHAESKAAQDYYERSRTGDCDLPSEDEHETSSSWSRTIVRQFGLNYEEARSKVAFLNISAYKSPTFKDGDMLTALPSCRIAIDWAQNHLFPEAEAGKRVVICLRAARKWGLEPGMPPAGTLFAPSVVRSGTMNPGTSRDYVIKAVREAVSRLAT